MYQTLPKSIQFFIFKKKKNIHIYIRNQLNLYFLYQCVLF